MEVILVGALAFILWIGGRKVIAGEITPGELIAFLGYLGFLVQPIRVCSRAISPHSAGGLPRRIGSSLLWILPFPSHPLPLRSTREISGGKSPSKRSISPMKRGRKFFGGFPVPWLPERP